MSLVPVTVKIIRYVQSPDSYGGSTTSSSTAYGDREAWINYPSRQAVMRIEQGAGVTTRTLGLIKFEPIPANTTILINDRIEVEGGDTWKVIGMREYEYTLQLDVELVSGVT